MTEQLLRRFRKQVLFALGVKITIKSIGQRRPRWPNETSGHWGNIFMNNRTKEESFLIACHLCFWARSEWNKITSFCDYLKHSSVFTKSVQVTEFWKTYFQMISKEVLLNVFVRKSVNTDAQLSATINRLIKLVLNIVKQLTLCNEGISHLYNDVHAHISIFFFF